MAETVYKKIAELDSANQPLTGAEVIETSQSGASKKVSFTNIFGAGWWVALRAAFSAFKAPDSDHADNADTLGVGEEEPSDFHDAAQLTGAIHLDRIPAELTGKNASSVGGYAVTTVGDGLKAKHGYFHGSSTTGASIFSSLNGVIPNTGDWVSVSGTIVGGIFTDPGAVLSRIQRSGAGSMNIYGISASGAVLFDGISSGDSNTYKISIAW